MKIRLIMDGIRKNCMLTHKNHFIRRYAKKKATTNGQIRHPKTSTLFFSNIDSCCCSCEVENCLRYRRRISRRHLAVDELHDFMTGKVIILVTAI